MSDADDRAVAVLPLMRRATLGDVAGYLAFMVRNREFLEPWEPIRADSVFTAEWVAERLAPDPNRCAYVALDDDGAVVGQAMLANFARAAFQSCTLGYSVDEACNGRGIATALVRHVVADAFGAHRLHRVEAATLLHNAASQRVLAKCGFTRIGISPRHVRIAGSWQDHVLYATTSEGAVRVDRPAHP